MELVAEKGSNTTLTFYIDVLAMYSIVIHIEKMSSDKT